MSRAIAVNRHKPRPAPAAQNLRYLIWISLLCFTAAFAMTRGALGQRRTDSSMAVVSRLHSLRTAIETDWVQHGTVYPGAEGLPQLLEQLMSKTNALGEVGVGPSFAYGP